MNMSHVRDARGGLRPVLTDSNQIPVKERRSHSRQEWTQKSSSKQRRDYENRNSPSRQGGLLVTRRDTLGSTGSLRANTPSVFDTLPRGDIGGPSRMVDHGRSTSHLSIPNSNISRSTSNLNSVSRNSSLRRRQDENAVVGEAYLRPSSARPRRRSRTPSGSRLNVYGGHSEQSRGRYVDDSISIVSEPAFNQGYPSTQRVASRVSNTYGRPEMYGSSASLISQPRLSRGPAPMYGSGSRPGSSAAHDMRGRSPTPQPQYYGGRSSSLASQALTGSRTHLATPLPAGEVAAVDPELKEAEKEGNQYFISMNLNAALTRSFNGSQSNLLDGAESYAGSRHNLANDPGYAGSRHNLANDRDSRYGDGGGYMDEGMHTSRINVVDYDARMPSRLDYDARMPSRMSSRSVSVLHLQNARSEASLYGSRSVLDGYLTDGADESYVVKSVTASRSRPASRVSTYSRKSERFGGDEKAEFDLELHGLNNGRQSTLLRGGVISGSQGNLHQYAQDQQRSTAGHNLQRSFSRLSTFSAAGPEPRFTMKLNDTLLMDYLPNEGQGQGEGQGQSQEITEETWRNDSSSDIEITERKRSRRSQKLSDEEKELLAEKNRRLEEEKRRAAEEHERERRRLELELDALDDERRRVEEEKRKAEAERRRLELEMERRRREEEEERKRKELERLRKQQEEDAARERERKRKAEEEAKEKQKQANIKRMLDDLENEKRRLEEERELERRRRQQELEKEKERERKRQEEERARERRTRAEEEERQRRLEQEEKDRKERQRKEELDRERRKNQEEMERARRRKEEEEREKERKRKEAEEREKERKRREAEDRERERKRREEEEKERQRREQERRRREEEDRRREEERRKEAEEQERRRQLAEEARRREEEKERKRQRDMEEARRREEEREREKERERERERQRQRDAEEARRRDEERERDRQRERELEEERKYSRISPARYDDDDDVEIKPNRLQNAYTSRSPAHDDVDAGGKFTISREGADDADGPDESWVRQRAMDFSSRIPATKETSAFVRRLMKDAPPNSVRQRVDVEREEEEIRGPLPTKTEGLLNLDTVSEKVNMILEDGWAELTVKVRCERIVPIRGANDLYKKSSVIVSRIIDVDLTVTKERRDLYDQVMENRRDGNRLSNEDTFELYKAFMELAEAEEALGSGAPPVDQKIRIDKKVDEERFLDLQREGRAYGRPGDEDLVGMYEPGIASADFDTDDVTERRRGKSRTTTSGYRARPQQQAGRRAAGRRAGAARRQALDSDTSSMR